MFSLVVSNNKQNEQNKVVVIVPLSSKVHNIKLSFQAPTMFRGKLDKAKCEQVRAVDIKDIGRKTRQFNRGRNGKCCDKKLMVVLDLLKYLG